MPFLTLQVVLLGLERRQRFNLMHTGATLRFWAGGWKGLRLW
jgi:hypothetical protein